MKKHIAYIAISFLVFGLSSCSSFLEQTSPDREDTDGYWRNLENAEHGLASAYAQLECSSGSYLFSEVKFTVEPFREDIIDPGSDAYNYPDWLQLSTFTYNNSNTQFTNYWRIHYRGIQYANEVLEKTALIADEGIDTKYRDQIVAEARFLRAYYHMKLLLNWEKIILRDKYIRTEAETSKPLEERAATWQFIVAELELAAANMPEKQQGQHKGRAPKGAAYAFLGYSYLTMAYEEPAKKNEYLLKAEIAFNKVTGFELINNYASMFDGSGKNSAESLLEVQFTESTAGGAWVKHYLHRFVGEGRNLRGWECIAPSNFLYQEFMKEGKISTKGYYDTRMYKTLYFRDTYFSDPTTEMVYGKPYEDFFVTKDGSGNTVSYDVVTFRKYLPYSLQLLRTGSSSLNVPVMRYADVLLLLAETLNELGKSSAAIPHINKVRARADMPVMTGSTYEEVKKQIEHERIVEFALENTRFYDMRRWGVTKERLHAVGRTNFDPAKHNFYPIPQVEITANDALK